MTGKQAIKWLADYLKPYLKKRGSSEGINWDESVTVLKQIGCAHIICMQNQFDVQNDIIARRKYDPSANDMDVETSFELMQEEWASIIGLPPFDDFIIFGQDAVIAYLERIPRPPTFRYWDSYLLSYSGKKKNPFFSLNDSTSLCGFDAKRRFIRADCNKETPISKTITAAPVIDDNTKFLIELLFKIPMKNGEAVVFNAIDAPHELMIILTAFSTICNINACINTEIKTTEITRHEATALTKNRIPTRSYHEIVIKGSTRRPQDTDSDEPTHTMALHLCRGHIKHYGPDKPLFGRFVGNVWCPPHMKGRAENGIIEKTYRTEEAES